MNPSAPPTEISSLIRLLDDPDEFVLSRVRDRLIELGGDAVPFLEIASKEENPVLRTRIQEVLKKIAPQQLAERFLELSRTAPGEDIDLEKGVDLLMQYGHPQADSEDIGRTLDELSQELKPRLDGQPTPEQAVGQLTKFLFQGKKFSGNKKNYFDPDNSYFDTVLSNKTGIPITLSVLCIFIGQRLGLPLVGIGLPGHFILKYNSPDQPIFFDPFHQGRILTPEDCATLVQSFGVEFEKRFLLPITHREILIRMIHNLVVIYNRTKDQEKIDQLTEYSKILMKRA
ncbi:MAG: hypothetical protein E2O44_07735 [Nitrospina sp.]|nr:MAG: hypothetical protein E2O44_07735 [Nitrospina sp.]